MFLLEWKSFCLWFLLHKVCCGLLQIRGCNMHVCGFSLLNICNSLSDSQSCVQDFVSADYPSQHLSWNCYQHCNTCVHCFDRSATAVALQDIWTRVSLACQRVRERARNKRTLLWGKVWAVFLLRWWLDICMPKWYNSECNSMFVCQNDSECWWLKFKQECS